MQTASLGDLPDEVEALEEKLEQRDLFTLRYRVPPDGKQVVSKVFELRTFSPLDRKNVAFRTTQLTGGVAWSSLPSDYRGWVTAMATVLVMFKDQPDADWLILRCERNAVLLDRVFAEVEAFWAASFPEVIVVGEGEESEAFAIVEIAKGGARPTAGLASRPASRRPSVTPAR